MTGIRIIRSAAAAVLAVTSVLSWLSSSAVQAQGGWQAEARRYGWQLNLDAACNQARRSGKPLMVVLRCIP